MSMLQGGATTIPHLERVCVCVWSCQSLEVEEWDKGIVHNRAFSPLVIVGMASSILVAMVTVFI